MINCKRIRLSKNIHRRSSVNGVFGIAGEEDAQTVKRAEDPKGRDKERVSEISDFVLLGLCFTVLFSPWAKCLDLDLLLGKVVKSGRRSAMDMV